MLHLASKRYVYRCEDETKVLVYSNFDKVSLYVNGELFEEKEGRHLHVWIMPRHEWMKEVAPYITDQLGAVLDYALEHMKTEENFKRIDEITKIVRSEWNEQGVVYQA